MPVIWLLRGRAYLKTRIAEEVELDVTLLPMHQELLSYLREQKNLGRPIFIATAAARSLADQVSGHLGFVSGVIASDVDVNLKGSAKAQALVERFGHAAFDYAGNSSADFAVWKVARGSVLVDMTAIRAEAGSRPIKIVKTFPRNPSFAAYFKALRIHHWLKNTLVLVPLLASQTWAPDSLLKALLAFFAFGFAASGTYIVNDLFDLGADRKHTWKRNRPFAAGDVPIHHGLVMAAGLFLSAIATSLFVNRDFLAVLGIYVATTLLYSSYLKTIPLLDVMALTFFYTLRVFAGGAAISIPLSFWLLAFAIFLFMSLAFGKRCAELYTLRGLDQATASGRGYSLQDAECLRIMGVSGGYAAVLVLALFINSPEVILKYRSPNFLWLLCPLLLYWINWIWIKASRGELHENPLIFSLYDRTSRVLMILSAIAWGLAV
jgi:4-hydroxybenzoate polyprenyltransferase